MSATSGIPQHARWVPLALYATGEQSVSELARQFDVTPAVVTTAMRWQADALGFRNAYGQAGRNSIRRDNLPAIVARLRAVGLLPALCAECLAGRHHRCVTGRRPLDTAWCRCEVDPDVES